MSLPRFGVTKPVPVNLLMAALLIAGLFSAATMVREFFPETQPESASITLPYPGATPEEIEESLAKKVEDAIADLDEVDQITTSIAESGGGIFVEFRDGIEDVTKATDELERAIDTLTDLPADAERITVAEFEPRLPTIMISVFGDAEEKVLKEFIRVMRDELRTLPGMGEIAVSGVRDYEVRVDVDPDAVLMHGLSLPQIADAIRAWMVDVPGGTVRSEVGNINVRAMGVAERADAIRQIVVKATPGGQSVRVSDIATVRETFVDQPIRTRFRLAHTGLEEDPNGPSASLTVYKVGDQDAVAIAEMARAYARGRLAAAGIPGNAFQAKWTDKVYGALSSRAEGGKELKTTRRQAYDLGYRSTVPIPPGCLIATHSDLARFIEGRLDLLVRNARVGAILVFATLLLFLNWRTAFWVGVGLATALAGTLMFMTTVGITLNLLTMFGLIVVLGLLVDDAIVVAENITTRHDRGEPSLAAAIRGTEQVFWPVVATVLTSIVAFLPLTFVKGTIGDLIGALPWVVFCALTMSLVESVLILPSHMGHSLVHRDRLRDRKASSWMTRIEAVRDSLIMDRIVPAFGRLLDFSLRFRYVSLAIALATLIVSLGMVAGGRLEFVFLPDSDSETIIAEVDLPTGASLEDTQVLVERIEAAAAAQPETLSISSLIGATAAIDDTQGVTNAALGTHLGQLFIELRPVEDRVEDNQRDSAGVIAAIREASLPLDGVERFNFDEIQGGPGGADITVQVTGDDESTVSDVVARVKHILASMEGVFDISDDNSIGQREIQIELKPAAASLGFTVAEVARQVRATLYGEDAHVFAAAREDIDVRVRLDESARQNLNRIENLWLIDRQGDPVPLREIATLREGESYNTIRRIDRKRCTSITADTAPGVSPESITPVLEAQFRQLAAQYPSIGIEFAGRQRQMRKAFESLPLGFGAALIMIYLILAWLFSSYVQPLAVMLAIPFGVIGVVWGHLILGYQMTFLSLIGFVALSGIVVNDSLILVQFYNQRRRDGQNVHDALVAAGRERLRPIFLTTITTVLGLTPLMLETSFQAKFLIPMAISIAFGLMSATVLILLVLPCFILMLEDLKAVAHFLWFGAPREKTVQSRQIEIQLDPDAG
jgi:HAE1 family hydrophobic/amphiphilic exporter-1